MKKLQDYLTTCSNEELNTLFEQVEELNKKGSTDKQPLRDFLNYSVASMYTVPSEIMYEISKRWNKQFK